MNDKEISEIKRSLSDRRQTIPSVLGYYVQPDGSVIATFERSLGLMGEDEVAKYLSLFRRALSGSQNKNLFDIPFSTKDATDGEEHGRLMKLYRGEGLAREATDAIVEKIKTTYHSDDPYVVLFAKNRYDVITHSKNADEGEETESLTVYTYFMSVVCPVKMGHATLAYNAEEKTFADMPGVNSIGAPALGFLFPAFDDRTANIYDALFYTKGTDSAHEELIPALFGHPTPFVPGKVQKEGLHTSLCAALDEDLSFTVAKKMHKDMCDKLDAHKESRDPVPLLLTKTDVVSCLEEAGVTEDKLEKFSEVYTETLGKNVEISPKNIVAGGKLEVKLPDVSIKVAKGKEDLITTKMIGGVPFVLIRADAGVEVNGLHVHVQGETSAQTSDDRSDE